MRQPLFLFSFLLYLAPKIKIKRRWEKYFFCSENELNSDLSGIIENARDFLFIISPYIKLHERIKSLLSTKKEEPKLSIVVVFGKNEFNTSKSLSIEDLEFFKDFPNIEIRYERRLHAKLYANEQYLLLTSMNLYDYSQYSNIEAGIIFPIYDQAGEDAIAYFRRVIDQSELIYKRTPEFESKRLGLKQIYVESVVEIDNTKEFFSRKTDKFTNKKRQFKKENPNDKYGFCIRTGKKISFNLKMPFSPEAYESWQKYKNEEYPEKYCHLTGEPSYGKTSFKNPVLKKNWPLAKKIFNL